MTSEIELQKEQIKVFNLKNKFVGFENKFDFYKEIRNEYREKGKVSRKVHTIRLFLLNIDGNLYLSRRSRLKKENTLLFDKTIGAHIRKNETPAYTALREAEEELGFPAIVLDKEDFRDSLKNNLSHFGALNEIETISDFDAVYRYIDSREVVLPQITTIFIGVYDGPIKFEDAETDIIELFGLDELKGELKNNPEKYTNDLKILIPRYDKELRKTIKLLKSLNK